ncbi:MAG TPA: hypothetical protein PKH79_12845 [Prolixibacteraceae bacterium]|nr:hypothetical protein [Prolixibacteraceae bacterium]
MANTIQVTKCDNELIILAFQEGVSYELCRILSGNNLPVSVSISIVADTYAGTQVFNGVNNALNVNTIISLPKGKYSLLLVGIDWGSLQQFNVNVNGTIYDLGPSTTGEGTVWCPGPIAFAV